MRILLFLMFICLGNDVFAQIYGCTDPKANNFNPNATINDGSCTYNTTSIDAVKSYTLPSVLVETSGLIQWKNKFWTQNDDTDINLYSIDLGDSIKISPFKLNGTNNVDWEDLSQDKNYIYVGDFGNNYRGNRTDLKILRVEKNSLIEGNPKIDTINFVYSLQKDFSGSRSNNTDFDCEAFIVSKDSIYLFTKEWLSQNTSFYSLPKIPGNYTANYKNTYEAEGLITGATYLEDKRLVILVGYSKILQPFIVLLYDFKDHDFFSGNKREIILTSSFHQCEGISTNDGLNLFVSNEKVQKSIITIDQKIQQFDLKEFLSDYLTKEANSINETDAKSFNIYQDRESCNLIVKCDSQLISKNFEIYNINGQLELKGTISSEINEINTERLQAGVGIFVLKTNKVIFSKFIKE